MRRACGQIVLWVGALMPIFLGIVGLVGDGGVLFVEHRRLQGLADGAARQGAAQLDTAIYRTGGVAALDPRMAEDAARAYLALRDPALRGMVAADQEHVTVQIHVDVSLVFLRAVGMTTAPVGAQATARLRQVATAAGSGP